MAGLLVMLAALQWGAPVAKAGPPQQDAAPAQPGLDALLTKTVGTDPANCGQKTLAVQPGATVYYCYTLTNTGTVAIDPQDLIDNLPGGAVPVPWARSAITEPSLPLQPNAVLTPTTGNGLIRAAVINESENNVTASWSLAAADGSDTRIVTSNPTTVTAATLSLQATLTVGTSPSTCANTVALALTNYQTRFYFCVALNNSSTVPLSISLSIPAFQIYNFVPPVSAIPATGIAPNQQISVTAVPTAGVPLTEPSITARAYVTGTLPGTGQTVSVTTDQVKITGPAPQVAITKYVISDPNAKDCPSAATTATATSNTQVFYYCVVVNNSTSLTYTVHHFSEPSLKIDEAFNYLLGPSQRITLTNATLPITYGVAPVLGPITATKNINSTLYYTAGNPQGNFFATAQSSSSIVAPTRAPTSTREPTATFTQEPGPSPTPTWTLTPIPATPTPSPTWTPSPTLMPVPTVLTFSTPGGQAPTPYPPLLAGSQPVQQPQPTPNGFVSPLDPLAAATATAVAMQQQGQFPTPVLDPFGATATAVAVQQQGQFPTPVLDPFGATATAIAVQQFNPQAPSPLATPFQPESPLEQPPQPGVPQPGLPPEQPTIQPEQFTPTPAQVAVIPPPAVVITVTATPTPEPSTGPTQRPIQPPTPPPPADGRSFFVRVLDSAGATLTLLWFLAGSALFFVTAGVLAGLSFRSKERGRYQLSEGEEPQFRTESAPPPEDEWPDSLP